MLALVLLAAMAAWFAGLEHRGLFIPDEGRYAEIPREMLASGDWITPRLDGLKYLEKPPLQYWLTGLSFRLLGEDEWTARLPSALLGFLALLLVAYTGARLWGARSGALAAVLLGTSWAYYLGGQYLTLDMALTAFLTCALCAFLLAQAESEAKRRNVWMAVAWAAAALAVLSKGLIGVVLPAGALLAYGAFTRETGVLRRLNPVAGIVLLVSIAVPWFIAVQQRNPEFFDFFFVHEHFRRFAEAGHQRPGAWWYYVPILLLGLMPWTPAFLREAMNWLRRPRRLAAGFSPEAFCAAWIGVILVFFSASQSKLPAYILPAFPAIALALASRLRFEAAGSLQWSAWGTLLAGAALTVVVALLPQSSTFAALGDEAAAQTGWLFAAAGALAAAGAAAVWSVRARRTAVSLAILAAGSLASWNLLFQFLHGVDDRFSSEQLIEALTADRKPFHPELPFYSVAQFDTSVPFYLGRTVTLVGTRGELGPGIDAEPGKAIATVELFEERWREDEDQAYAVLPPQTFAELRQKGLPMTQLLANKRLVVVSRRAPGARSTPG